MDKDIIEGKATQFKGKMQEEVGKVSDNPKLEARGKVEQMKGKVQEEVGRLKDKF